VNTDPLARARLSRIIHCDDVMTKVLRCGNTFLRDGVHACHGSDMQRG